MPIPEDKPKKKRGGRKQHKFNQKFKITEVRQSFNRLKFGVDAEEEYRETGEGFGMLSKETGKVKLNIDKEQKLVICNPPNSLRLFFLPNLHARTHI